MGSVEIKLNSCSFKIDNEYYSEVVISKSIYWLSGDYTISVIKNKNICDIIFKKKNSLIDDEEVAFIESKLFQNLNDFKVREQIEKETSAVKNILLVKALANGIDTNDGLITRLLDETNV